jgi:hypothetical protein
LKSMVTGLLEDKRYRKSSERLLHFLIITYYLLLENVNVHNHHISKHKAHNRIPNPKNRTEDETIQIA